MIKKQQIHSHNDPEKAAQALCDVLITSTIEAIQQRGRAVWAVSGGSSIHNIYDMLNARPDFWQKYADSITVTWVDERHVPHSSKSSNYGNALRAFWSGVEGVTLLPVPYLETVEESAKRYQSILKEKKIGRSGIDISILGMGTDGHVASLFPGHVKLNEEKEDVVSVRYESVEESRISMTYPMINSCNVNLLYFYGSEKRETFQKALKSGDKEHFPVCGILQKQLHIFTDQKVV